MLWNPSPTVLQVTRSLGLVRWSSLIAHSIAHSDSGPSRATLVPTPLKQAEVWLGSSKGELLRQARKMHRSFLNPMNVYDVPKLLQIRPRGGCVGEKYLSLSEAWSGAPACRRW